LPEKQRLKLLLRHFVAPFQHASNSLVNCRPLCNLRRHPQCVFFFALLLETLPPFFAIFFFAAFPAAFFAVATRLKARACVSGFLTPFPGSGTGFLLLPGV